MVFASLDPTSDIDMNVIPAHTELLANYPNPFNPETVIRFTVEFPTDVSIDIYNVKGQRVHTILDGHVGAGYHQVVWDGTDDLGRDVSSGIYFYRMNAGEYSSIRKMLLMK
jgi:ABC-type dipeptide/oligopeptide/nickel transport system permease subunit